MGKLKFVEWVLWPIAGTATLTVPHELDESPHVTAFLLYTPPGHCVGVFILRIVARQI